jgi:hypothetical protein
MVRSVAAGVIVPWLVLASVGPASSWNDAGHQVVSLIAWDTLSPGQRVALVALMRQAEARTRLPGLYPVDERPAAVRAREFFLRAATWPDLIRDVPELHHATWHHRSFYWRQERGLAIDLPDVEAPPENLLERLGRFVELLAAVSAPSRDRALAIAWVLHLVGDIHQPLHCSARVTAREPMGDHGGQDFGLPAFVSPRPTADRYSLHAYWDDTLDRAVPRGAGEPRHSYVRRAASIVVALHPRARLEGALKPGQFDAWARESLIEAQRAYPASLRRGEEPPAGYREMTARVIFRRLALAGYRLGLMLQEAAGIAEPSGQWWPGEKRKP